MTTKTEWLVQVGGGHNGPRPFDNEADALAYYEAEMAVPSYMGAGHKRQGSVTKVTTISEAIRPAPAPAAGRRRGGEVDRAIKRMRGQLVGSATFTQLMFGREDVRLVLDTLSALRAQPQAHSGESQ